MSALPDFAPPSGRCCLAPDRVPWLWPAASLSGVPRCPALVRRGSSGRDGVSAPAGFPVAVVLSLTGGFCPLIYWAAARRTWGPAEKQAHGACRWPLPRRGRWARSASYLFRAPLCGCRCRVPPLLVSGCVRCSVLASVDPVTQASGFLYRPSFNWGLSPCTGAVSCGR